MRLSIFSSNATGNMLQLHSGAACAQGKKRKLAASKALARATALPTRSQPKYSYSCMATVLVQLSSTCGVRRCEVTTRKPIHVVA